MGSNVANTQRKTDDKCGTMELETSSDALRKQTTPAINHGKGFHPQSPIRDEKRKEENNASMKEAASADVTVKVYALTSRNLSNEVCRSPL